MEPPDNPNELDWRRNLGVFSHLASANIVLKPIDDVKRKNKRSSEISSDVRHKTLVREQSGKRRCIKRNVDVVVNTEKSSSSDSSGHSFITVPETRDASMPPPSLSRERFISTARSLPSNSSSTKQPIQNTVHSRPKSLSYNKQPLNCNDDSTVLPANKRPLKHTAGPKPPISTSNRQLSQSTSDSRAQPLCSAKLTVRNCVAPKQHHNANVTSHSLKTVTEQFNPVPSYSSTPRRSLPSDKTDQLISKFSARFDRELIRSKVTEIQEYVELQTNKQSYRSMEGELEQLWDESRKEIAVKKFKLYNSCGRFSPSISSQFSD